MNMKKIERQHEDLLTKNAFTLLRNYRRILNDPRMRYATIKYTCGEAKNGVENISNPTVGAYIEWWTEGYNTINLNTYQGHTICHKLTVKNSWMDSWMEYISDSGTNDCQPILSAKNQWNRMKNCIENHTLSENETGITPYTFEEVIEILNNLPTTNCDIDVVDYFFQKQYIAQLEREIYEKHRMSAHYKKKYHHLLMSEKRTELEELYNKYHSLNVKLFELRDEKYDMSATVKKDVKKGAISQKDANKVLDSIEKEISDTEDELNKIRHEELGTLFPNEWIHIEEIKEFLYNTQYD